MKAVALREEPTENYQVNLHPLCFTELYRKFQLIV